MNIVKIAVALIFTLNSVMQTAAYSRPEVDSLRPAASAGTLAGEQVMVSLEAQPSYPHAISSEDINSILEKAQSEEEQKQALVNLMYNRLNGSDRKDIEDIFYALHISEMLPELWRFFNGLFIDRQERHGFGSFYLYLSFISEAGNESIREKQFVCNEIYTALKRIPNYTRPSTGFMRFGRSKEHTQEFLQRLITQKIEAGDLSIRAKSIGISSGEEPYGIAMHIYYALKEYYEANVRSITTRYGYSRFINEWLAKWDVTIEAYDRDLVNLALTKNGLFDFQYDSPYGISDHDDRYDDPWIIDNDRNIGETWQHLDQNVGLAAFPFREEVLGRIRRFGNGFYMPYQAKDFIRGWIKPLYVDIRNRDDMSIIMQAKANMVVAEYLKGRRRVGAEDSYIEEELKEKSLDRRYSAYISISDTEVIEPEEGRPALPKTSATGIEQIGEENIRAMYEAVKNSEGPDIVIVVSPYEREQMFWKRRLEAAKGQVLSKDTRVISIWETYGAGSPPGNGLGSLLAYKSAMEESGEQTGLEWDRLIDKIRKDKGREPVIAMYHTAGMARRVWPITGAEGGSKSKMGMPRMLNINGIMKPMTLLEATIFQSAIFAKNRAGRIMVFWGDQVFVPSTPLEALQAPADSPIEILAQVGNFKMEEIVRRYGLIALTRDGGRWFATQHMEKPQSVPIAENFIRTHSEESVLGKSLGSFTVELKFWGLLIKAWSTELNEADLAIQGVNSADTDRDWWMPLTELEFLLNKASKSGHKPSTLNEIMGYLDSLGISRDKIPARIVEVYLDYLKYSNKRLMHVIDIGADSFWWDFGSVEREEGTSDGLYRRNILVLLKNDIEGRLARLFWGVDEPFTGTIEGTGVKVRNSIIIGHKLSPASKGLIEDSVVIKPKGCINFDSVKETYLYMPTAPAGPMPLRLSAYRAIGYKLSMRQNMQLSDHNIAAGIKHPVLGNLVLMTTEMADPEAVWNIAQPGNPMSFKHMSDMLRLLTRRPVIAGRAIGALKPKGFFEEYPIFEGRDKDGNNLLVVLGLDNPEELPIEFIKGISRPKAKRKNEPVTLALFDDTKGAMLLYYENVPQARLEHILEVDLRHKSVKGTKPEDKASIIFSDRHGNLLLPEVLRGLAEREMPSDYTAFNLGDEAARGPATLVAEGQVIGNHDAWALGASLDASLYAMMPDTQSRDYLFLLSELWHAFRYGTEEEFQIRYGVNLKNFIDWANQTFREENLYVDTYKKSPPLMTPRGPKTPPELAALILYLKASCNRPLLKDANGMPLELLRTTDEIRAIPRHYLELLGPDNAQWPDDVSEAPNGLLLGFPKRAEAILEDMFKEMTTPRTRGAAPACFENARRILTNNFYDIITTKRGGQEVNMLLLHTLPPMDENGVFKEVYIDGTAYKGFELLKEVQKRWERLRLLFGQWLAAGRLSGEDEEEYNTLVRYFLPMVSLGRYSVLTAQDENRDGFSFPQVGTKKGSYEELRNIAYTLIGVRTKRQLPSSGPLIDNLREVYHVNNIDDPKEIARKVGDFLTEDASRALGREVDIIAGGHVSKTGVYADGRVILIDPEWAKKGGVGSFNDKGAALLIASDGRFFMARPYKVGRLLSYGSELKEVARYIGLREIRHYGLDIPWQSLRLYPKAKRELINMLRLRPHSSYAAMRERLEQVLERPGQVNSLNEDILDELYYLYRYAPCESAKEEAFRRSMASAVFGGHPMRVIAPALHVAEIDFPDEVVPFWKKPGRRKGVLVFLAEKLHEMGIDIKIGSSFLHNIKDEQRLLARIQNNTLIQDAAFIYDIFYARLRIAQELRAQRALNEVDREDLDLFEVLFTDKHPVLRRHKDKALHVAVARGGRGGAAFTSRLCRLAERLDQEGVKLFIYIIPGATDFGRSWNFPVLFFYEAGWLSGMSSRALNRLSSEASAALGLPQQQVKNTFKQLKAIGLLTGIPDYYKSLLDLGTNRPIIDILSWRVPGLEFKGQLRIENMDRDAVYDEMERFFTRSIWYGGDLGPESFPILSSQRDDEDRLWQLLERAGDKDRASRDEVLRLLKSLYNIIKIGEYILKNNEQFKRFDWRAIPVRSLVAIALRFDSKSWQESLDKASKLLGVEHGRVMVTTKRRKAAIGITGSGEILPDEDTFNEAAKVYNRTMGLYQHLSLSNAPLTPDDLLELQAKGIEDKRRYLKAMQGDLDDEVSDETLRILKNIDLMVFLPTTFMSNIGTMLTIQKISRAIAGSKAFKVFWANSTVENDYLMSVERYILLLYGTATNQLGKPFKDWDMSRLGDFINLAFVNGSKLHPYENEYIPEGNLRSLKRHGLVSLSTNIEDPNPEDPEGKYEPDKMQAMTLKAYELSQLGYEFYMRPDGLVGIRLVKDNSVSKPPAVSAPKTASTGHTDRGIEDILRSLGKAIIFVDKSDYDERVALKHQHRRALEKRGFSRMPYFVDNGERAPLEIWKNPRGEEFVLKMSDDGIDVLAYYLAKCIGFEGINKAFAFISPNEINKSGMRVYSLIAYYDGETFSSRKPFEKYGYDSELYRRNPRLRDLTLEGIDFEAWFDELADPAQIVRSRLFALFARNPDTVSESNLMYRRSNEPGSKKKIDIRFIDYELSFRSGFSDGEVRAELERHRDYYLRYAPDMLVKIADLSDKDIKSIVRFVYKKKLVKAMPGSGKRQILTESIIRTRNLIIEVLGEDIEALRRSSSSFSGDTALLDTRAAASSQSNPDAFKTAPTGVLGLKDEVRFTIPGSECPLVLRYVHRRSNLQNHKLRYEIYQAGKNLGYVKFNPEKGELLYIEKIYIKDEYSNKGIGGILLGWLLGLAASHSMYVTCTIENPKVFSMFERSRHTRSMLAYNRDTKKYDVPVEELDLFNRDYKVIDTRTESEYPEDVHTLGTFKVENGRIVGGREFTAFLDDKRWRVEIRERRGRKIVVAIDTDTGEVAENVVIYKNYIFVKVNPRSALVPAADSYPYRLEAVASAISSAA